MLRRLLFATSDNTALCTQYSQPFTLKYSHLTLCKESPPVRNLCHGHFRRRYQVVEVCGLNFGLFVMKQNLSQKNNCCGICNKRISSGLYIWIVYIFSLWWIDFVMGCTLSYTIHDWRNHFSHIFKCPSGEKEWGRECQRLKRRGFQTCILHEFSISAHI